MAHRITKKQIRTHVEHKESQPEPAYYQSQPTQKQTVKLPRPTLPSVDSIYHHDKSSYRKGHLAFPPPESLYFSRNNYDAGPDFLRPTSAMMLGNPRKTSFPFGAWVNPLGSYNVQAVQVKSPLRCGRCKAYINPYFRFDGTKSSALCNICGINFAVQQTTDPANLNTPEIMTEGVMDFIVNDKIYIRKRLDLIKIIIVIEMGHFMSETDAFRTVIQSVKSSLENTTFEKCIRLGVVYFNAEGTTYLKLKRGENFRQKTPKRYTVKNGNINLCCPLSDKEMLFDPNQEKEELLYILDYIDQIGEDYYKNSKFASHGASYPSALKSLIQNFEKQTGRIMLFAHTTPKAGSLAIRPRTEEDHKHPLKPLNEQYRQFAKELKTAKVGVDMYLFSKDPLATHEIATVHYLSSLTGGSVQLYSPFQPEQHGENLYYNIYGSLSRRYVYDVDFTARVSNGLSISCFGVGNGIHETRDVSLGMMDPANTVSVHFQHEEKIQENSSAFLQFAMMFTNGDGERIVRILNYRYLITNKIESLHEACDYLALSNILLRQANSKLPTADPGKVREQIINKLIGIITQLVQQSGTRASSTFMAHPSMAPTLAYVHSFINSKVILNYLKAPTDFRMCEILKANTYNFIRFANYFYPKLFSLGIEIYEAEPAPGDPIEGEEDIDQCSVLPPSLALSSEGVAKDGVYLKWSEDYLLILVQPEAPEELLIEIFGTSNWDEIEEGGLPELETPHNIRINVIVEELRRRSSRANGIFLPIVVRTPRKKGPYQDLLSTVLKEEYPDCRYFSFLDTLHRQVQMRLK